MPDLLHHLISNEVGTSAFLGTLMDPRYEDRIFVEARAAIAGLLKQHGVEVTTPAPTLVQLEYLNIDLVAAWSPWTLLIENKVASASVTRGQLKDYYSICLLQLERNGFLPQLGDSIARQPICFMYLTPTLYTGVGEFDAFELDAGRGDKKIHVAWSAVLDCLTPVIAKNDSRATWFLGAGLQRVREVIQAARATGLPEDERRNKLQALMNDLRTRVQTKQDLFFQRWSDHLREQLYAALPARVAYVGLYLSYNGTKFPSGDRIRPVGDLSFDVASKHRPRLRALVASKSALDWAERLDVPPEQLHMDSDKGIIAWRFALPEMHVEEFLDAATKRLTFFLSVFSGMTVGLCDKEAAKPEVAADAPPAARR